MLVLAFDGEYTAKSVWGDLLKLEEAGVVEIEDAVIAWREAPKDPSVASPMAAASITTAAISTRATDQMARDSAQLQIEQAQHPLKKKYPGAALPSGSWPACCWAALSAALSWARASVRSRAG